MPADADVLAVNRASRWYLREDETPMRPLNRAGLTMLACGPVILVGYDAAQRSLWVVVVIAVVVQGVFAAMWGLLILYPYATNLVRRRRRKRVQLSSIRDVPSAQPGRSPAACARYDGRVRALAGHVWIGQSKDVRGDRLVAVERRHAPPADENRSHHGEFEHRVRVDREWQPFLVELDGVSAVVVADDLVFCTDAAEPFEHGLVAICDADEVEIVGRLEVLREGHGLQTAVARLLETSARAPYVGGQERPVPLPEYVLTGRVLVSLKGTKDGTPVAKWLDWTEDLSARALPQAKDHAPHEPPTVP